MLDKRNLYRFPWSMNDNPIAWLEITDICNIYCEGCYRQRLTGHKTLEEVKEEILFFKQWRNPDNVSIAGGEPLIHPDIVDIVAFIAENGIKPVILTNAVALNPELLRELKAAGLPDTHVQRLTRLFEGVRYGARVANEREERQAVACLTAIVEACTSSP